MNSLETLYPNIVPGVAAPTATSQLPEFVAYFAGLGIIIAGFVALVSFAIGAVRLIISGDNPSARTNGLDQIKSAVLGLMLLMASWLILRTINPVLVEPVLTPLPPVAGVFYYNEETKETLPCPQSEPDTANIPEGFNNIKYICANASSDPILLVWKYPMAQFSGPKIDEKGTVGKTEDMSSVLVDELACDGVSRLSDYKSFKVAFQTPGLYYFLDENCPSSSFRSEAQLATSQEISAQYAGKIKSVKIVNSPKNALFYGLIFHEDKNFAGSCAQPYGNYTSPVACVNAPKDLPSCQYTQTYSINIFNFNPAPATSGDGFSVYSAPYGWDTGSLAGYLKIPGNKINPFYRQLASQLDFKYDGINITREEKALCKDFGQCPESIKINGNYLAGFYSAYADSALYDYIKAALDGMDVQNERFKNPVLCASKCKTEIGGVCGRRLTLANSCPLAYSYFCQKKCDSVVASKFGDNCANECFDHCSKDCNDQECLQECAEGCENACRTKDCQQIQIDPNRQNCTELWLNDCVNSCNASETCSQSCLAQYLDQCPIQYPGFKPWNGVYCELFPKTMPNLKAENYYNGSKNLQYLHVLPIK